MLELLKLIKELKRRAERAPDIGALFAVDDPTVIAISTLATIHLTEGDGLNRYNVRTLEMQTGAKVKIIDRDGDCILGSIFICNGFILFG